MPLATAVSAAFAAANAAADQLAAEDGCVFEKEGMRTFGLNDLSNSAAAVALQRLLCDRSRDNKLLRAMVAPGLSVVAEQSPAAHVGPRAAAEARARARECLQELLSKESLKLLDLSSEDVRRPEHTGRLHSWLFVQDLHSRLAEGFSRYSRLLGGILASDLAVAFLSNARADELFAKTATSVAEKIAQKEVGLRLRKLARKLPALHRAVTRRFYDDVVDEYLYNQLYSLSERMRLQVKAYCQQVVVAGGLPAAADGAGEQQLETAQRIREALQQLRAALRRAEIPFDESLAAAESGEAPQGTQAAPAGSSSQPQGGGSSAHGVAGGGAAKIASGGGARPASSFLADQMQGIVTRSRQELLRQRMQKFPTPFQDKLERLERLDKKVLLTMAQAKGLVVPKAGSGSGSRCRARQDEIVAVLLKAEFPEGDVYAAVAGAGSAAAAAAGRASGSGGAGAGGSKRKSVQPGDADKAKKKGKQKM